MTSLSSSFVEKTWFQRYVAPNRLLSVFFSLLLPDRLFALLIPQRAAQRIVSYWEERRKLFGPRKYLMSMTLSEALREDVPTLQSGVFSLIPQRDSSGRNIIYRDQSRRNVLKHSTESLVRACHEDRETQ